jgi:hypothetical protein
MAFRDAIEAGKSASNGQVVAGSPVKPGAHP